MNFTKATLSAEGTSRHKHALTAKPPGSLQSYRYKHHFVTLKEGMKLAYVDEGDRDKPVILFLHGVGAGIPVWEKNISFLRSGYRCIALDLPGHGFSSKEDYPYTMSFYAESVLEFAELLQLENICLAGHSMGAQIAIKAAEAEPALINTLVLLAPSGAEPYLPAERMLLAQMITQITCCGLSFTHNQLTYLIGCCNDTETSDALIGKLAFFSNEAGVFAKMVGRSVRSMLFEPVTATLPELRQPCLILLGNLDRVSPYNFMRTETFADLVERVAAGMKCAQIHRFESGHFAQFQDAELFNGAITNFLRSVG